MRPSAASCLAVRARPSVLWCYKKELGLSTYKKKRMRAIKKMVQRGLYDAERDDPFELFISSTNIRWAFYNETDKIMGQTFGMVVLQDFAALTPNLLARTVETVEGGGCVVVLLKKLDSLRQLYTMTMDAHARFRTEAHANVKIQPPPAPAQHARTTRRAAGQAARTRGARGRRSEASGGSVRLAAGVGSEHVCALGGGASCLAAYVPVGLRWGGWLQCSGRALCTASQRATGPRSGRGATLTAQRRVAHVEQAGVQWPVVRAAWAASRGRA